MAQREWAAQREGHADGVDANVRAHVRRLLPNQVAGKLTDDTLLISDGYLTSLETVDLVMNLEQQFGIEIPADEVTEDEFRSIRSIGALVERKLATKT
jgi:acyl carrier protein